MKIDLASIPPVDRYRILIQSVVPRPIAWILTANDKGNYNLAPFSYFSLVHSDPPLMTVSIGRKADGTVKDTRANIERSKKFVIHIASADNAPLVTRSSLPRPYGESEVDDCKLKLCEEEGFELPRLMDAKIAMYCELDQVMEIGRTKSQGLIFGEIKRMYLIDDICNESEGRLLIDATKLDPLGRFGGNDYGTLGKVLTVDRPEYNP